MIQVKHGLEWLEWCTGVYIDFSLFKDGHRHADLCMLHSGTEYELFWHGLPAGRGTLEECKAAAEKKAREG